MALLCFLSLLCSCSGLRGKADTLFQQGAYRKAVEVYEAALKEDPTDEAASAGLKKARRAFVDRRLLEVRKARLATHQQLAMDILLEVVELEKKWGFFPLGAVASTQGEECTEALRFIDHQIGEALTRNRPLWGLYLIEHYKPLFSGVLDGQREALQRKLARSGTRQCALLSRSESPTQPYFSSFVRKICTAWGQADKGRSFLKQRWATLFGGLQLKTEIEGLPDAFRSDLAHALNTAFEQTAWFEPQSKRRLPVRVNGVFLQQHTTTDENRVHGYEEEVPYTAFETVKKSGKTKQRRVTRYRFVHKTQPYNGQYHEQTLELRIAGDLKIGKLSKPLHLDESIVREGFEHHWNLPDIGLTPEMPALEDPARWFNEQADQLASQLQSEADALWNHLYCEPMASEPTLVSTGELVHRCLRSRRQTPPAFTDQWYQKFFGLSVAQADELLRFSDL